jgi:hypothetical protein
LTRISHGKREVGFDGVGCIGVADPGRHQGRELV